MMLGALVAELQAILDAYGDLPVWLHEPGEGLVLDIQLMVTEDMAQTARMPHWHVAVLSGYTGEFLIDAEMTGEQKGDAV
jgi:hypothetical protein